MTNIRIYTGIHGKKMLWVDGNNLEDFEFLYTTESEIEITGNAVKRLDMDFIPLEDGYIEENGKDVKIDFTRDTKYIDNVRDDEIVNNIKTKVWSWSKFKKITKETNITGIIYSYHGPLLKKTFPYQIKTNSYQIRYDD